MCGTAVVERARKPDDLQEPSKLDISGYFIDVACESVNLPDDPVLAARMIEVGITLNRVRCNDFFAERGGRQFGYRIIRNAVAPVSALLAGVIALTRFKGEGGQGEATQILGIGQAATVAGLELYQAEFLFGANNINSVRILTMRALDDHSRKVIDSGVGFFGAARHLIDHQMICTPANILDMSQTAIRSGRIEGSSPAASVATKDQQDSLRIATHIAQLTGRSDLDASALGSLWWQTQLQADDLLLQQKLAVIRDRTGSISPAPVIGVFGNYRIGAKEYAALLDKLPETDKASFRITAARMTEALGPPPSSLTTDADVIARVRDIRFVLPTESARAQETLIAQPPQ